MSKAPAPPAVDRSAAQALTRVFTSAGYHGEAVRNVLAVEAILLLDAASLPLVKRHVAAHDTPLAALVWLFLLGQPLEDPERRLGDGAELLVAAGLAAEDAGALVRLATVVPHDNLLIASDDPLGTIGADYIPEVARASATLASLTIRRPVERALDIGTGNGIQAVLAAKHARTVVATDISERALAFAEFNCALNGIENVELRQGSFLEPVTGERFELVVSNPPFVISPENELVFRDSGLGRDRVSETLVSSVPSVLEPDGYASISSSWIIADDHTDDARPREWLEHAGCDGWVLYEEPVDALTSAITWTGGKDDAAVDRWLQYFEHERISRIGYGVLVLRPRQAEGWTRSRVLPANLGAGGAQLERIFAGVDAGLGDLSTERLVLATDVEVEQVGRRGPGGWHPVRAGLRVTGGLQFETTIDDTVFELIRSLDGRPLASHLATRPPGERAEIVAVARGLLELGFLVRQP